MQLFAGFMKEIELARPGASDQVSEVDLSDAQRSARHAHRHARRHSCPSRSVDGATAMRPCWCISATAISSTNIACWRKTSANGAPAWAAWNRWTCDSPAGGGQSGLERASAAARRACDDGCCNIASGGAFGEKSGDQAVTITVLFRVALASGEASQEQGAAELTKKDRYLVALDIGSTKTCALIAELEEDGAVKFSALGAAESKGWRKGLIVNLDLAVSSIRRALEEAEGSLACPWSRRVVGVAGSHVRGVNSRGGITVAARPRDIEREDVRRAVEAARGITLPEDREVLHVLPQEFFARSAGQHPRSHRHGRPEAGSERAHRHRLRHRHAKHRHRRESRRRAVDDTALEPLASAEAVPHAGRARTGLLPARYRRRHHRADRRIRGRRGSPHRGDSRRRRSFHQRSRRRLAHADSRSRKNQARARRARFANLLGEDRAIEIASVGDRPPRTVFARMLDEIIEPRAQELLMLVRDELRRAGLDAQIPAGLVFTGGGARLRGLVELAENSFQPARARGRAARPGGMHEEVSQPEYSTAVGLVLYGARTRRLAGARPTGWTGKLKSMFAGQ